MMLHIAYGTVIVNYVNCVCDDDGQIIATGEREYITVSECSLCSRGRARLGVLCGVNWIEQKAEQSLAENT